VSANVALLKGGKLEAPLLNIRFKDTGKKEGVASAGEMVAKVRDAVTGAAAAGKADGSNGINELMKSFSGLASGTTNVL
jgi:hypothetical protein